MSSIPKAPPPSPVLKPVEPTTRKELWAWWMYNFALEPISVLGKVEITTESYPYLNIAISVLLQALVFITVGAMADYGPYRKQLLIWSTVFGVISCLAMLLAWDARRYWLASMLNMFINMSFGMCLVFYNAYLPLLATAHPDCNGHGRPSSTVSGVSDHGDEQDLEEQRTHEAISNWLSTRSLVIGYGAAVLVLALSVVYVFLGPKSIWTPLSVVAAVGVWWLLFSIWPFQKLKIRPGPLLPPGTNYLAFSWRSLFHTLRSIRSLPVTFTFLAAYFFYSDGTGTLGSVAVLFAKRELKVGNDILAGAVLLAAVSSLVGTFVFFRLQRLLHWSSRTMLMLLLGLLALIPVYVICGLFTKVIGIHNSWEMFLFAGWYGFLIGAQQSYSRVLFAELVPSGLEAEFFSLYAITDKGSSWMGPLAQAIITLLTNNQRYVLIFLLALISLPIPMIWWGVDIERGKRDARKFGRPLMSELTS